MLVLLVDGMGGGVGRSIAEGLKAARIPAEILVVGANASATANMMKAGITLAATGENPVIYNAARADIIIGPIGIILPNAMLGEITPAMAMAVAESGAKKILLPIQNDHAHIVGLESQPLAQYVREAVQVCREYCGG